MAKVRGVGVLVCVEVTVITKTEVVKGWQVGVKLESSILMILPVLPVQ